MSGDAEVPNEAAPISVSILETIRSAQLQHGLRHGDHGRYRQYCTRRLRRVYKGVKLLHGRGKYVKKQLDPASVTDARHLQVPLLCAERAWAMAMEFKSQLEAGADAHKRRRLLRRLAKAAAWAAELASLCGQRGDPRTGLEAEAYAAWMAGVREMERARDWQAAVASLQRSKKLVAQLARVGTANQQAACRARLEELEPPIRYCTYQLDKAGGGGAGTRGTTEPNSPVTTRLQERLVAFETEQPDGMGDAAHEVSGFEWRGAQYPAAAETVRAALVPVAAAERELSTAPAAAAGAPGSSDARLVKLDRLGNAYAGALAAVQSALANDTAADAGELKALEVAIRGAALERSIERSQLLARAAEARLLRTQRRAAAGIKSKDKERSGKPEDVVRLYDGMAGFAADLNDLAADVGGAAGEALIERAFAQVAQFEAARCFYTALSFAAGEQHVQAYSLMDRALQRMQAAVRKWKDCDEPDPAALEELARLSAAAMAYRCAEHAHVVAEAGRLNQGIASLDIAAGQMAGDVKEVWLLTSMEAWQSFAADGAPHVAPIPPSLQSIPARPILLDAAQDLVAYKSLVHRAEQRPETKSTFSRLFAGWGR